MDQLYVALHLGGLGQCHLRQLSVSTTKAVAAHYVRHKASGRALFSYGYEAPGTRLVPALPESPFSGRDWGQEEKGTAEDEMAGWHH